MGHRENVILSHVSNIRTELDDGAGTQHSGCLADTLLLRSQSLNTQAILKSLARPRFYSVFLAHALIYCSSTIIKLEHLKTCGTRKGILLELQKAAGCLLSCDMSLN